MNETELFDSIFGKKWKDKYLIKYCDLCAVWIITCEICKVSSCSSCFAKDDCECAKDFEEFKKLKQPYSYLSQEEMDVLFKFEQIKRYSKECFLKGFNEINWKYLKESGNSCEADEEYFPELKNYTYNPK